MDGGAYSWGRQSLQARSCCRRSREERASPDEGRRTGIAGEPRATTSGRPASNLLLPRTHRHPTKDGPSHATRRRFGSSPQTCGTPAREYVFFENSIHTRGDSEREVPWRGRIGPMVCSRRRRCGPPLPVHLQVSLSHLPQNPPRSASVQRARFVSSPSRPLFATLKEHQSQ